MPSQEEVWAVDLDGTLAEYQTGDLEKYGPDHIGKPIPEMVDRIKKALAEGIEVYIFSARTNPGNDTYEEAMNATNSYLIIAQFCKTVFGQLLPITHEKSRRWSKIFDDRAEQVVRNTGVLVTDLIDAPASQ